MSNLHTQAVAAYKASDAYRATVQDLSNGASIDEIIQGVSDNAYSVLSKVFTEDELEELEVLDVVEDALN